MILYILKYVALTGNKYIVMLQCIIRSNEKGIKSQFSINVIGPAKIGHVGT